MLWDAVQTAIASVLPASEYELWIKPIICSQEHDQGMLLTGPDRFFCAWVEQRYMDLIRQKCLEAGAGGHRKDSGGVREAGGRGGGKPQGRRGQAS